MVIACKSRKTGIYLYHLVLLRGVAKNLFTFRLAVRVNPVVALSKMVG